MHDSNWTLHWSPKYDFVCWHRLLNKHMLWGIDWGLLINTMWPVHNRAIWQTTRWSFFLTENVFIKFCYMGFHGWQGNNVFVDGLALPRRHAISWMPTIIDQIPWRLVKSLGFIGFNHCRLETPYTLVHIGSHDGLLSDSTQSLP